MALQDMTPADLAAVVNNDGDSGFGNGNGWWIILLFLFLGWGNRGWGGGNAGDAGGDVLYPWMENQANIYNGFSTLTNAVTSGFANAETAATARQMADMQQMFGLSQQFAQCCCDNRLATANLTNTVQAEGAANRLAVSDGVQRVLDQLCQDKIDAKNDEIARLRTQVEIQNLAASQNAQTAAILADNARQTTALEQYLNPTPIPAYQVANPNCCQAWQGCGCGM